MAVSRFLPVLLLALASPTVAADNPGERPSPLHEWAISIWGLSYHFNRSIDYNENNWGAGLRFMSRPPWNWMARSDENRAFVEVDALKNSYGGLVLPASIGAELKVGSLSHKCNGFAVGALTIAYYDKPGVRSSVRLGPIPGFSVGCGRIKSNLWTVLSPSKAIVAALVASVSIVM